MPKPTPKSKNVPGPFKTCRLPKHKGSDKPDDLFVVEAVGNPELVKTGESPANVYITGFGGTPGTGRTEAKRLAGILNTAFTLFHQGLDETHLAHLVKG